MWTTCNSHEGQILQNWRFIVPSIYTNNISVHKDANLWDGLGFLWLIWNITNYFLINWLEISNSKWLGYSYDINFEMKSLFKMSPKLSWSWMGLIILRFNIPNDTTKGWVCPWFITKTFVKPNNKHATIRKIKFAKSWIPHHKQS